VKTDEYGQAILDINDVFDALYSGKQLDKVQLDDHAAITQFNSAIDNNADNILKLTLYQPPGEFDSRELFDKANQCTWFMPEEYRSFPIHQWLLDQCTNEQECTRVEDELLLFIQHGMFDLLFYLKYLVDTMHQNNVVWGVGRGSSVASYVLYLLGVHKIDSLKYNLDIHEFLK
jgi:DNA polymerase III alpha subunit